MHANSTQLIAVQRTQNTWTMLGDILAGYLQDGRSGMFVAASRSSGLQSKNRPIFVLLSISSLVLKLFAVFAVTAASLNIFHFEITRNETSSAVAEMGDRSYNRHGPKRGAAVPLSGEGLSV